MGEVYFKHRELIEQAFIKLPSHVFSGGPKKNYVRENKIIYNNPKRKHYIYLAGRYHGHEGGFPRARHSKCVDLCDFPHCGKLDYLISNSGDCISAFSWLKTKNKEPLSPRL